MELIFYSLLVSLFWGISPVLYKIIMKRVDTKLTFIINHLFFNLGLLGYTFYYWKDLKSDFKSVSTQDIIAIGAISIVLSFIPNIIYYNLINNHDSYLVTALINSSPIFTVALSYLILKENITKYSIIGVVLIIIGIYCLTFCQNKVK
jgi:transporter family protein